MNDSVFGVSATRLYGGAIGVVSGGYAVATSMDASTAAVGVMLVVGILALGHGLVLFTPLADRLAPASGPLMLVYAFVMLGLQAWAETMGSADGMDGMGGQGMNGMGRPGMAAGADPGMVALALLMLFSGIVMSASSGRFDLGR